MSFKSGSGEILTQCPRLWPLSGVYSKQEICPRRGRDHNANIIMRLGQKLKQLHKTKAVKKPFSNRYECVKFLFTGHSPSWIFSSAYALCTSLLESRIMLHVSCFSPTQYTRRIRTLHLNILRGDTSGENIGGQFWDLGLFAFITCLRLD